MARLHNLTMSSHKTISLIVSCFVSDLIGTTVSIRNEGSLDPGSTNQERKGEMAAIFADIDHELGLIMHGTGNRPGDTVHLLQQVERIHFDE